MTDLSKRNVAAGESMERVPEFLPLLCGDILLLRIRNGVDTRGICGVGKGGVMSAHAGNSNEMIKLNGNTGSN